MVCSINLAFAIQSFKDRHGITVITVLIKGGQKEKQTRRLLSFEEAFLIPLFRTLWDFGRNLRQLFRHCRCKRNGNSCRTRRRDSGYAKCKKSSSTRRRNPFSKRSIFLWRPTKKFKISIHYSCWTKRCSCWTYWVLERQLLPNFSCDF